MDLERRLQFEILRYLDGLRLRGYENRGDELTVAVQCLGTALNIDITNPEQQQQYGIAPLTLPEVFGSGISSLENPRFKKFYQLLVAKGFFNGVQEGTEAYAQRMALMKQRYEAKFATEQPSPASCPPSTSYSSAPSSLPSSSSSSSSASSSSSSSFSFSPDAPLHLSSSSSSSFSPPPPVFVSSPSFVPSPPTPSAPPSYAESIQSNGDQKTAANKRKLEGNSALAQGRFNDAIQAYSAAILLNPSDAVFWTNRAAAQANMGMWEQARSDAEQAVKLDAQYSKAHYRLGQALLNLGRAQESISPFENAIRLTPNESDKAPIRQQLEQARARCQPHSSSENSAAGSQQQQQQRQQAQDAPAGFNLEDMFQGGLGLPGLGGAGLLQNPQMRQMMQGLQQGLGSFGGLFGGSSDNHRS